MNRKLTLPLLLLVPMFTPAAAAGSLTVDDYLKGVADNNKASSSLETVHYAKGVADAYLEIAALGMLPGVCGAPTDVSFAGLDIWIQGIVRYELRQGTPRAHIFDVPLTTMILKAFRRQYPCEQSAS